MSTNPYESPLAEGGNPSLPLLKATAYVAGTTAVSAVIGCLVGCGIGAFAPEYYRVVFHAGSDPNFRPVAIGGVLGLLQGSGVGMAVGILLVIMHWWFSFRVLRLRLKLE